MLHCLSPLYSRVQLCVSFAVLCSCVHLWPCVQCMIWLQLRCPVKCWTTACVSSFGSRRSWVCCLVSMWQRSSKLGLLPHPAICASKLMQLCIRESWEIPTSLMDLVLCLLNYVIFQDIYSPCGEEREFLSDLWQYLTRSLENPLISTLFDSDWLSLKFNRAEFVLYEESKSFGV